MNIIKKEKIQKMMHPEQEVQGAVCMAELRNANFKIISNLCIFCLGDQTSRPMNTFF